MVYLKCQNDFDIKKIYENWTKIPMPFLNYFGLFHIVLDQTQKKFHYWYMIIDFGPKAVQAIVESRGIFQLNAFWISLLCRWILL